MCFPKLARKGGEVTVSDSVSDIGERVAVFPHEFSGGFHAQLGLDRQWRPSEGFFEEPRQVVFG